MSKGAGASSDATPSPRDQRDTDVADGAAAREGDRHDKYPSGEPRWVAESWGRVVDKVGPSLATAYEFALHPVRFVRRWSSGERFAQNPLSFAIASAAVVATVQSAVQPLLGIPGHHGLFENIKRAVAPHVYYAQIGLVAHALLAVLGSKRHLSSSLAMALYAGGTMWSLGQVIILLTLAAFRVAGLLPDSDAELPEVALWTLSALLTLSFGAFFTLFATAMGALHRVSWIQMLLANCLALLVTSLVADLAPLPTLHVAVRVWQDGHFIAPSARVETGL